MAYTSPSTVAVGDVATASLWNTNIRDNLNALVPDAVVTGTSWTPVLTASTTNPTLGSGSTQYGTYWRVGPLIIAQFRIQFGTAGVAAGSGAYRISLPVNCAAALVTNSIRFGSLYIKDSSTSTHRLVIGLHSNAAYFTSEYDNTTVGVSDSTPWVWAASDEIQGTIIYLAA